MDHRYFAIENPLPRTCTWLLDDAPFRTWSDTTAKLTPQQRFLWLKAKAGAGKSTLMKATFEKVRHREVNSICTAFFFNARGQAVDMSYSGLLSSLLFQLLTQRRSLIRPLVEDSVFGLSTKRDDWKWDISELKAMFSHCIRSLPCGIVLIFIDALDECAEEEARSIVKYLKQLSLDCEHTRVCISSRFYPHITAECREIDLNHGVTNDITTYVAASLPESLDGQDSAVIKQRIVQKASGVFLWVVLMVGDILAACDREESFNSILNIIERIPGDLKDVLGLAMQKIRPESHPKINLVFRWMLLASEPLDPSEVVALIRLDPDPTIVGGMAPFSGHLESMEKIIRAYSGGLLEVKYASVGESNYKARPYVQFIHEAVREYIRSSGAFRLSNHSNDTQSPQDHHGELANFCMDYLSRIPNFREGTIEPYTMSKDLGVLIDRYKIIIAAAYRSQHQGAREMRETKFRYKIKSLILDVPRRKDDKFFNLLSRQPLGYFLSGSYSREENDEILRPHRSAPLLHTLGQLLTGWTDAHVSAAHQLLFTAAEGGQSLGSAFNKEAAQNYSHFSSSFPFMRRAVCELFMHAQKASNVSGTEARILQVLGAPKSASMRNLADAATILNQVEPALNRNTEYENHASSESNVGRPGMPSHAPLLLRLLSGFDLAVILDEHLRHWPGYLNGFNERELLLHAFQNGSPQVAALLLHRGARIALESSDTLEARTVITWDQEFFAKLFSALPAGKRELADISSFLLSILITFGKPEAHLIKYLIANGADINVPNDKGHSPLIQVARADSKQCADFIQILLECGADPNFTDSLGRACLHYLAGRANTVGIERLLKAKPIINIKDKHGETPWDFADLHGNDDVLELLALHCGESGRAIETVHEARLSQEHPNYDSDQWELSGSDGDFPWDDDSASAGD